jgi:hypothetical protein
MKHENKADRGEVNKPGSGGNIGCSKYYQEYGKKGLTGGVMAAWCPHLICLGFHCIPTGEGRNDAFSLLYTRWEKAPRIVIYNFACALAPYCMLREPKFFKNTLFLIDSFHSSGHMRCSRACFVDNYRKSNPQLQSVNTSAAECGNSGLQKIRVSLSCMSQRHAVIFTNLFLAMWNRARIRKSRA